MDSLLEIKKLKLVIADLKLKNKELRLLLQNEKIEVVNLEPRIISESLDDLIG